MRLYCQNFSDAEQTAIKASMQRWAECGSEPYEWADSPAQADVVLLNSDLPIYQLPSNKRLIAIGQSRVHGVSEHLRGPLRGFQLAAVLGWHHAEARAA